MTLRVVTFLCLVLSVAALRVQQRGKDIKVTKGSLKLKDKTNEATHDAPDITVPCLIWADGLNSITQCTVVDLLKVAHFFALHPWKCWKGWLPLSFYQGPHNEDFGGWDLADDNKFDPIIQNAPVGTMEGVDQSKTYYDRDVSTRTDSLYYLLDRLNCMINVPVKPAAVLDPFFLRRLLSHSGNVFAEWLTNARWFDPFHLIDGAFGEPMFYAGSPATVKLFGSDSACSGVADETYMYDVAVQEISVPNGGWTDSGGGAACDATDCPGTCVFEPDGGDETGYVQMRDWEVFNNGQFQVVGGDTDTTWTGTGTAGRCAASGTCYKEAKYLGAEGDPAMVSFVRCSCFGEADGDESYGCYRWTASENSVAGLQDGLTKCYLGVPVLGADEAGVDLMMLDENKEIYTTCHLATIGNSQTSYMLKNFKSTDVQFGCAR